MGRGVAAVGMERVCPSLAPARVPDRERGRPGSAIAGVRDGRRPGGRLVDGSFRIASSGSGVGAPGAGRAVRRVPTNG